MRIHFIAVAVLAFSITGCRELVEPSLGYDIVQNILSPVQIRTSGLEGAGWIKAYTTNGRWELIHLEPAGSFTFHGPLPPKAWHCDPVNGSEGCVAILRAGDEKGYLEVNGRDHGKFHICTENYVQKIGRKHCGNRRLVGADDSADPVHLDYTGSEGRYVPAATGTFQWFGDAFSRFFHGVYTHDTADTYNPPTNVEAASQWFEHPYHPTFRNTIPAGEHMMSVDVGACSLFIPWEWSDRIRDDLLFTPAVGIMTNQRGIAEIMLDGIIENNEPETSVVRDVFLYMDALTNVRPRTDISPEFHVRVSNTAQGSDFKQETQICLKNYFLASNDIREGVDAWYRWDQGILSGMLSLFGVGNCREHPASVFYCGAIDLDQNGRGRFRIDPDVRVNIEGYSVFKPACNNQFIPGFKDGMEEGIRTVGAQNLSDGINDFVRGIEDNLGIEIRRIEPTPTGVYVVTAAAVEDPQYGIGLCRPDIEAPDTSAPTQPSVVKSYPTRGITRF